MKRTIQLGTSVAFFLALALVSVSVFRAQQRLTTKQILAQMAKMYAECESYQDSGTIKYHALSGDFNRSVVGTFSTAFARPNRLRYEVKGEWRTQLPGGETKRWGMHYTAWRKNQETYVFDSTPTPKIEKSESLSIALAGGTGISGGAATISAYMLLPAEFKGDINLLTDMQETSRLEDVLIDRVDCYCIEGEWADRPTTVWIDKKTFLLRKLQWKDTLLGITMESTTTWKPSINQEISDEVLDLNAPEEN